MEPDLSGAPGVPTGGDGRGGPAPTSGTTGRHADRTSVAAEDRGGLEVRTRAIRTIVERAVLETPGTVAHRGGLGRLPGQGHPKASVDMHGRSARVSVDVACVWPCSVTDIAAGVRTRVRDLAARYSGVHVPSVDVVVHVVSADDVDETPRRVE